MFGGDIASYTGFQDGLDRSRKTSLEVGDGEMESPGERLVHQVISDFHM